jgi:hypothetical protein
VSQDDLEQLVGGIGYLLCCEPLESEPYVQEIFNKQINEAP